jgi:DNA-binding CsgD family transcriptional regulator
MEDHRAAAGLCRELGDPLGEARNLVRLSYLRLAAGDQPGSESALDTATGLLEALPPSRELALAYEARSRRLFMANQPASAEAWAGRAAALAEQVGDRELALEGRVTGAVARLLAGDDGGRLQLAELLEALSAGSPDTPGGRDLLARLHFYLALIPMLHRRYEDVDRHLEDGWRFALEHDLEYWQSMMAGTRTLRLLDAGRWREAEEEARAVLATRDPAWRSRLLALLCLGRVRSRTGQPDAAAYLDQASEMGRDEPAMSGVIWPARAEAAWLAGDRARALREAAQGRESRSWANDPWFEGELAFWGHLAGAPGPDAPERLAEPYRLAIGGRWAEAARWWEAQGCPYEMAITLAAGDDPDGVRRAVAELDRLGAAPAAAYARRRLRELGVASVPRGPRPSTAANPAGLTRREREVLELAAGGLTNAEIAARLFLSEKTVERHLAGVFSKLNAGSRAEAVLAATRVGALPARQIEGPPRPN